MILRRCVLATLLALSLLPPVRAQIKVVAVEGDAELIRARGGAETTRLVGGEEVSAKDRIITGMDSTVQLAFGGNSVVVVKELTDFKVGEFAQGDDQVRTRLWLKAGEVSAEVNPNKTGGASDFSVKTPTATCSVRGTGIDVSHAGGQTQQRTRHGSALFFSDTGRTLNNANQGASAEADGEFTTQAESDLFESVVTTLPGGASEGEQDAVENSGPTSNSGGAAPGDDAAAGASNDGLTNLVETVNEEVFDQLVGNDDLPPSDPNQPIDRGVLTVAQLQARTGDTLPGTPPNAPGAADTFATFSKPASSALLPDGSVRNYFVARSASGSNEGLFQSENGVVTALLYKGQSMDDPAGPSVITFDGFDFDGSFNADEPVLDSSDGRIVAFQARFNSTDRGLFVHDSTGAGPTIRTIVDDKSSGTHGRMIAKGQISNHFSVDGFLSSAGSGLAEVAFVATEQSSEPKIYVGNGVGAAFAFDSSQGAIAELGVSRSSTFNHPTQGAKSFIDVGGFPFRDLSYRISHEDANNNNLVDTGDRIRREVAFVGHYSGGEGVFMAGRNIGVGNSTFDPAESIQPIALAGQDVTNISGVGDPMNQFTSFRSVSISRNESADPGRVAFIGHGTADSGTFQGIYANRGGALHEITNTRISYTIPGFNSDTAFTFDHFDSVNFDGGQAIFSGQLDNGSTGLFAELPGQSEGFNLSVLAGTGDIVPPTAGANAEGTVVDISIGTNGADLGGGAALAEIDPTGAGSNFTGVFQNTSSGAGPERAPLP